MSIIGKTAFWKYYFDLNFYNLLFSIIVGLVFGLLWFVVSIFSSGFLFAIFAYNLFQRKQYYFYFNLGISKYGLISRSLFLNVFFAISILLVFSIVKKSFFNV